VKDWKKVFVDKIVEADGDVDKIRQILKDVYDMGWADAVNNGYDNIDSVFSVNDLD